ncbi:MAG: beta-ketoacyl-[acyl-carrier-protein] synthase family protein [Thermoleophilia bacterium]
MSIACEASAFEPTDFVDRRVARRADRATLFALAAAQLAMADAGATVTGDGGDIGCVFSSGTGGNGVRDDNHRVMLERGPDRISPFAIPHSMGNVPSAQISMDMGLRGPVFAAVTACAGGCDAVGMAGAAIRRGDAKVMIAGGCEAMITPFWVAGFDAMRVLSHRFDDPGHAGRPFDAGRDGFLIGEGAAALILEDADHALARGATIICELAGYGASADAHHLTDPDPTGAAQARAMRAALADAGVHPEEVGYVHAHGGASQPGDPTEVMAIRAVLGEEGAARTAVSATKSMHGHCMGATGAVEAALTALAVAEGRIPPTIATADIDPACTGVDHVLGMAREADLRMALNINNGLGGHNAAVLLRRWES